MEEDQHNLTNNGRRPPFRGLPKPDKSGHSHRAWTLAAPFPIPGQAAQSHLCWRPIKTEEEPLTLGPKHPRAFMHSSWTPKSTSGF